jgi:hypothetical protein
VSKRQTPKRGCMSIVLWPVTAAWNKKLVLGRVKTNILILLMALLLLCCGFQITVTAVGNGLRSAGLLPTLTPTATRAPTSTPLPTHTPLPTRTPRPTRTPKPTATQRPAATPTRYLTPRISEAAPHDPLFVVGPADDERGITRDVLSRLISRIGERAGVEKAHPHRFRHTFAVNYLRNGGDVLTLQRLLGHESLEMVRHYANVAAADCAAAHKTADPVDNWRL